MFLDFESNNWALWDRDERAGSVSDECSVSVQTNSDFCRTLLHNINILNINSHETAMNMGQDKGERDTGISKSIGRGQNNKDHELGHRKQRLSNIIQQDRHTKV